ncbi:hypothetical protein VN97_g11677 [Penicillium thymicola]|uniref:Uncharacterized protein n=1 Tax=Penicillium thymicola TaxID=293382 RepID=A0AAI9X388_PENTH|nr:hypothetical protein VN97_g11677 [Penicillium thymicola]
MFCEVDTVQQPLISRCPDKDPRLRYPRLYLSIRSCIISCLQRDVPLFYNVNQFLLLRATKYATQHITLSLVHIVRK